LAVDDYDNADTAYFGAGQDRRQREIIIPLSIGGGVSFTPEMDMERAKAETIDRVSQAYNSARGQAKWTAALSGDLHAETLAAIEAGMAHDTDKVNAAFAGEIAKQEAAGVRDVAQRYDATNEAERDAFAEFCAVPCKTLADARAKGEHLAGYHRRLGCYLEADLIEAFAMSLTGQDGREAFA
jgi:hypothetical protein